MTPPPLTPEIRTMLEKLDKRMQDSFGLNDKRYPLNGTLQLLFVEDDRTTQMMLTQLLKNEPVALSFASTAEKAVELYCQSTPHIIFLDIDLGAFTITGLNLLQLLVRYDPLVYPVMLTSHATQHEVHEAKTKHVKGYIIKPFTLQKLLDTIRRYHEQELK